MSVHHQRKSDSGTRTRRAALILLALFLHAALAGATHLHLTGSSLPPPTAGIAAGSSEAGHAALETTGHAQCLLCRLQRDLASGLINAGPAINEPPPTNPRFAAAPHGASRSILRGLTQGRAPPPA